MEMKMKHAPSRLSLRTAATAPSRTMNTLLCAGLGGALLALATACSGEMDAGSDEIEGDLEDQASEVVDVSDAADAPEPAGAIEKATFNDSLTYNGFNVGCTAAQKQLINAADARAREILATTMPATAEARVNRNTSKARTFRVYFVPDGSANPDPNRASPDAVDTAVFRVGQKLAKVSQVLPSAIHTCHGGNESVRREGGVFKTCNQTVGLAASTDFVGGAENAIRWCDFGLSQSVDERAVTLLHELTHQDRTADATGGRVFDDSNTGRLYNAHNYSSWFRNNL
jgi:hypothetical protein